MSQLHYFIYLIIFVNIVHSARILCVYPIPYHSHQKVLRVLPEELVKLGHEVVIITPEPVKKNTENLTEIDVSEVTNKLFNEGFTNGVKSIKSFAISATKFFDITFKVMYPITDAQFTHSEVQELINDKMKSFDLILAEDGPRAAVTVGARFQAPIILVTSCFAHHDSLENLGSEANPLLFPFLQKAPVSFWDRFLLFLESMQIKYAIKMLEAQDNALISKHFGKKSSGIKEVKKNVHMALLGTYRMWDSNRAVGPSVTYMGAIHLKQPVSLPADLQNYLDGSEHGMIYMSLGSKVRSSDLPSQIVRTIVAVFASLPYDVIWKWDGEEMPMKPTNVRLEKWLPQADLLRHPSIKLFITQGGLQSTDEAIAAKVPLLGLPVFADQFQNIQKYQEYGIGLGMEIDDLNEEDFREAIREVAENVKYRKNVQRLSSLILDQRTDGIQRALHQIQKILDHGSYFPSPAVNASLTEYFMLDVFAPLVLVVFLFFVSISIIIRRLISSIKYYRSKIRKED